MIEERQKIAIFARRARHDGETRIRGSTDRTVRINVISYLCYEVGGRARPNFLARQANEFAAVTRNRLKTRLDCGYQWARPVFFGKR